MRRIEMRDILIYMDTLYEHSWNRIMNAIEHKVRYPEDEVIKLADEQLEKYHIITLVDDDYPYSLKNVYKMPFVIKIEKEK